MRESVKIVFDGLLAKVAVITLALAVTISLGANPLLMQQHMANSGAPHEATTAAMPAMPHEAQQASSGGFCVQMAPCTAIMSQAPEMRALGIHLARLVPAPVPLADSRALAPPFHPPIV